MVAARGAAATHYPAEIRGSGPEWNRDRRTTTQRSQSVRMVRSTPRRTDTDAGQPQADFRGIIAAEGLTYAIAVGDRISDGDALFTITAVETVAPDGSAIVYLIEFRR